MRAPLQAQDKLRQWEQMLVWVGSLEGEVAAVARGCESSEEGSGEAEPTVDEVQADVRKGAKRRLRRRRRNRWMEAMAALARDGLELVALRAMTKEVLCPLAEVDGHGAQAFGMVPASEVKDDGLTDWHGSKAARRSALEARVRREMAGRPCTPHQVDTACRGQQRWDERVQLLLPRCRQAGARQYWRPALPGQDMVSKFLAGVQGKRQRHARAELAAAQARWASTPMPPSSVCPPSGVDKGTAGDIADLAALERMPGGTMRVAMAVHWAMGECAGRQAQGQDERRKLVRDYMRMQGKHIKTAEEWQAATKAMRLVVDHGRAVLDAKHIEGHDTDYYAYARGVQPKPKAAIVWAAPAAHVLVMEQYLAHELGQLARCCRFFGAKRGAGLGQQSAGLSLCDMIARNRCTRLGLERPLLKGRKAGEVLAFRMAQPTGEHDKQFWATYNKARKGTSVLRGYMGQISVNAQSRRGRTALNHAALQGESGVVTALVELRARLDIRDGCGRTALHNAALNGHAGTVKVLVEAGADQDAMDSNLCTPLQVALQQREKQVATRDQAGNVRWYARYSAVVAVLEAERGIC